MKNPASTRRPQEKIDLPFYGKFSIILLMLGLIVYYATAVLASQTQNIVGYWGQIIFMVILAASLIMSVIGIVKDRPRIFSIIGVLMSSGLLIYFIAATLVNRS